MPAIHDYECPRCGEWTEHIVPMNDRPATQKCACGGRAEWRPCAPHVHTLATFSAGIDDEAVQRSRVAGTGDYIDPTLSRDRRTGKITPITSRKHREELMKAKGLAEYGDTDLSKDTARLKRTRPIHFGAGGVNRRAHG